MRFIPDRPVGGCWEYQGTKSKVGYGNFRWGTTALSKKEMAHRASWLLFRGPIPKGVEVCHKCDNPPCVNPDHLFLGTRLDNMRDASSKGRLRNCGIKPRELCRKGLHPVHEDSKGRRQCRHCQKIRDRERWLKYHPGARTYDITANY